MLPLAAAAQKKSVVKRQTPPPAAAQKKELDRLVGRLKVKEHVNLLQGAMWTVTHDYADSRRTDEVLNEFVNFLTAVGEYEKGNPAAVEKIGGLPAFREKLIIWLADEDQSIRAFAAIVAGIVGDRSLAPNIAALLVERKLPEHDFQYDRSRAAIAIGLLGAKEYAPRLAELLTSRNEQDRTGAAYGLGFLAAKEYAEKIARLLKDDEENVREAAREALKMIGAADPLKNKR